MKYTETQLAYLAGILDGEGTISICDKRIMKRKSRGIRKTKRIYRARINFTTSVTVCNTDIVLMNWLVATFGGAIYKSKRQKADWKSKYTWVMQTSKITYILQELLPYLVLKRKQAELMIEARKTFDSNQRQLETSDEVYNRRLEIAHLIRCHNQKILPPCCP